MFFRNTNPLLLFAFLLPTATYGQDLTGIWKGYFITKDFSQYKVEFQIKKVGASVTGFSYSYQSTVFYAKSSMNGRWNNFNKLLLIQELKTVEIKNAEESVTCLMNYNLEYSKSGREEYLEGSFTSKYEFNSEGIKKRCRLWGRKSISATSKFLRFLFRTFLTKNNCQEGDH